MGWGDPGGLQEGGVGAKPLEDGLASGAGGELVHAQIAWRSRWEPSEEVLCRKPLQRVR